MTDALIVFHVQDAAGKPIGGALLSSVGGPGPWQGLTNPCGDFIATLSPADYTVTISAQGFAERVLPATLKDCGVVTIGLESTLPPFKAAPRFWTGNMCGVHVPGLPPVPGGASDPTLVLSWFYDRYPVEWRKEIRTVWHWKGYVHVLLSWPDCRAHHGTAAAPFFASICAELVADGFYPCVMLCAKDIDPPDVPTIMRSMADVLPLLVPIVPLFCVGWELSLWLSPTQVQQLIDWVAVAVVPKARLYVHFQQGYGSFQQPGMHFADFWNLNVGKLTGLLHQKILSQTPEEYRGASGGLVDILDRFAGGFGCAADSGFGHPFDLVALEITAMTQFEGSTSEANGDALGTWAIQTPAVGGVTVMGSGNGLL